MGVKSFIKKSVAMLSAVAMAFSMTVIPTGSVFAEESTEENPLQLRKSAELQKDGTYKITLEAWAKGEVTVSTEKSGTPLDIVLVLDQSGSMYSNNYVKPLKDAVTSFVNTISKNANEYNVDHRIAMVGYASDNNDGSSGNSGYTISSGSSKDYWINTGLFVNGKLKNYGNSNKNTNTSLTSQDYRNALVSVNTNNNVTASITAAIDNISASGCTRTQYGIEMANKVFENNSIEGTNRKRIVVVFTDGQPGYSSYETAEAGSAIKKAYETKNTYKANVYSVGLYGSANNDVTTFMNGISSNYPYANYNNNNRISLGTKASDKYYMTTSNSSGLSQIFENISQDIIGGVETVELDETAVAKDIISKNFDLPEGYDSSKVTVSTADYQGDGNWAAAQLFTEAIVNIDTNTKTIGVSNFNYKENYVADKTTASPATGKKLIIEITDVVATTAGLQLDTNDDTSGVYDGSGNLAGLFPQPKVDIDSRSYVLDYGKTVSTSASDYGVGAVTIANTGKPSPYGVNLTGEYGTFAISGGNLNYTPGKINWDGIDTGYVFGQKSSSTEYQWKEVNFIPATSVYYEDDFGLDNNTDANVAIVWTGEWSNGTSQDEQQSSSNSQYGWDDSYKDDTGFSNGSAHEVTVSNQTKATATFKFTGTGVDVYSRTNKNVGKILGQLKKIENDKVVSSKVLIVDNQSVSGDYYQIPTLSFDNLEYGTYELKINVSPVTESNGNVRGTYYLDGIRVYNPLGKVEANSTEGKAYEEAGESNAQYIQVRKILLDAATFGTIDENKEGIVFIDKSNTDTPDSTSDVLGVYKDYGPKNEVYAAKSQGVAFKIGNYYSSKNKVFIGLKSPSGQGTTVEVTNGSGKQTLNINSAADLYYPITPDSKGNIVIKNTGNSLLSITKVRITTSNSATTNATYSLMANQELMSYVQNFDSLYVTENDVNNEETKVDEETTLDKDDVVIENPSEDVSNENNQNNEEIKQNTATLLWQKVSSSISKLFGRK